MNIKRTFLFCFTLASFFSASAGNKIKYYFNKPVDTGVSRGVNASYLNNCAADTLAAYLERAKYSLDITIYSFNKNVSYTSGSPLDTVFAPKVAAAIDSAYARGVKVRIIYDGGNSNTGFSLLDPGIPMLGSPQTSAYGIMHNKFVVIDAHSPDNTDPIVWTGCMNWYYQQYNWDYNNIVVVQDSALASAYLAEFNMMWGDTGIAPNLTNSKFGPYKTDLGQHLFTIDGHEVELYFSPSDGTDSHIQSAIASADKDLYFGMYTFTRNAQANAIVTKYNSGLYVAGINDNSSNSYTPYDILTAGLGANFKVYNETDDSLYHNKFVVVDPSDTCSDPLVLTGSHNWTLSANTKNDENTLIIHDAVAANLYLQYFKASFTRLGGILTLPSYDCISPLNVGRPAPVKDNTLIYPNPSTGDFSIAYELPFAGRMTIDICDIAGRKIYSLQNDEPMSNGRHSISSRINTSGLYFVHIATGSDSFTKKLVIAE